MQVAEAEEETFCYGLPGAIAPAGEWDPAGLLRGKSKVEVYRWRESELTHGRISMLASVGFITQQWFHPLADVNLPVLEQVQHLPDALLFAIPTVIGFCETARSQRWTGNEVIRTVTNRDDGSYLGARSDEIGWYPGDIDWDPLGLKPADPTGWRAMQERELAHSRLAMLAAAGCAAQEAATGTTWGTAWGA